MADVAAATGAELLCETFPARLERGAGRPPVERLGYLAEFAMMRLDGISHLILVDAKSPVSFFAYPGKPSDLVPDGCTVHAVAGPADDLAGRGGRPAPIWSAPVRRSGPRQEAVRPARPSGPLTAQTVCQAIGALLPDGAIVSDEGNTSGLFAPGATAGAPPHDWLTLTGGAIGQGLPVAVGAAVAARTGGSWPWRPTGARCTPCRRGGPWPARASTSPPSSSTTTPTPSSTWSSTGSAWTNPVRGPATCSTSGDPTSTSSTWRPASGLHAARAETSEQFNDELARALATPGPSVVEAVVPGLL